MSNPAFEISVHGFRRASARKPLKRSCFAALGMRMLPSAKCQEKQLLRVVKRKESDHQVRLFEKIMHRPATQLASFDVAQPDSAVQSGGITLCKGKGGFPEVNTLSSRD